MIKFDTIFLVDDDIIYLSITAKTFNVLFPGSRVRSFRIAKDALDRIEKEKPDVVFLDINMPVMDGWEFLDGLKNMNHKVPVYIVSSSIDPDDLIKAKKEPMVVKFIEKPLGIKRIEREFMTGKLE
jgi:CheY-like chemotaxis protein